MNFVSLTFLIFLAIVLVLYYILPQKTRWILLLIASYLFYGWWNYKLLALIIFTTLVAYFCGIFISRTNKKSTKKLLLIGTIICSCAVLFVFKYLNFFIENFIALFEKIGWQTNLRTLKLLLPIGISFYTFQTMSYVIDVYYGKIQHETHLGYFALFVSFFPQLVAGPIERPEHLLPQLKANHKFDINNIIDGSLIALIGFFKKVVVADMVANYVNIVYNNPLGANGFEIVVATVLFAVQIYCDFSGYTDIAIGVSKMLGIELIQNFNKPYSATSIRGFWARWHISLTTWFRDYLYIPLGGNRVKKWRHLLNLAIVFIVSGLWHGAEWTFVIWGGLHAFYQIISIVTNKQRKAARVKLNINEESKAYKLFCQATTFLLVCFAWLFFRANSTGDMIILLKSLFTNWSFAPGFYTASLSRLNLDALAIIFTVISIAMLKYIGNLTNKVNIGEQLKTKGQTASLQVLRLNSALYILFLALIIAIAVTSSGTISSFIYFQF